MGSEGFTTAGWVVLLVKDPPLLVRAQSKKITFAADRSADRSAERDRTRISLTGMMTPLALIGLRDIRCLPI